MSALAPLREAADSLAKASTPQPFSSSRTSNWIARLGGLPDYMQHVAHGILRSDPAAGESGAIERAIGVVKNWASGVGKHVDANTRAAAAKAVAEWERMKGQQRAKGVLQHSWVEEADRYVATWADERRAIDGALLELAMFSQVLERDGMIGLLAEPALQEAAQAWSPTLKRTATAPQELERHEVYDGAQHVGTIARRHRGFGSDRRDEWAAFAVNGTKVSDYNTTSKPDALKALETHLGEAPARVIAWPTTGKYLVAQPSSYSGETSYRSFPNEVSARHAAGLPAVATVPESNSKVQKLAEALRWDLELVAHLDVVPLRRVQEARRRDPFRAR